MDETTVERWMRGYLRAWESNDPQDIGVLFTEDARYYTAPDREPWRGQERIVQGWLDRKDDPGGWQFRYELMAIAGYTAFVRGWTTYTNGDRYSNLWVVRLDDQGRASEYTEWWMEPSTPET
jgi:SnoaL-like domain